jgi:hypothetical protein
MSRTCSKGCAKGALRAGDRLFLSKSLGTGLVTTAATNGNAPVEVGDPFP